MKTTKHARRGLSLLLVAALMLVFCIPSFAIGSDITPDQEHTQGYTYEAPTRPMVVDDNIITATAHRAASPILGMMGVNATSGFGMVNGGAPSDFADAQECAALGIWGSSLNENPDPYYWNYFYNFYASETEGVEPTEDALINTNAAASPVGADGTLVPDYGNISVSLCTRPDIAVGCASTNSGTDTNGYDEQLATIHSFTPDNPYYQPRDETYSPKLVSYQTTHIKEMIESVYRLADAIEAKLAKGMEYYRNNTAAFQTSEYEEIGMNNWAPDTASGIGAVSGSSFTDVSAGSYFVDSVAWAVEAGITQGATSTEFAPDTDCNRAMVVTFLYRDFV